MITFPNAKINLGLHVIEKRNDGYHNIETIFYPISLCDALEVVVSEKGLKLFNYGLKVNIPDHDNICIRAYNLIKERYDIPPVEIHLFKRIPFGAGLGGGSSDAANMLLILNSLFELNITEHELKLLSLQLGSDCPFFLYNKAMYATGRGEILKPCELSLSGKYILLVKPPLHIPTSEAYQGITPRKPEHNLLDVIKLPVNEWRYYLQNDFETNIFSKHPQLKEIKSKLYDMGSIYASMSGSGSTIYGIFEDKISPGSFFSDCFTWGSQLF
ncbi:MAG: 4-(cytidine 5'-diphospho)-2-C-methyl-D-erythritol kinase [Bacteroidales bacterium]|nr:4-(cytidine 5'-diphospho)-2-C-methyl-D-erythritol kinase [Bacteroidales bacterium]